MNEMQDFRRLGVIGMAARRAADQTRAHNRKSSIPGGLEAVKRLAITKGYWRERENGRIERGPFEPDKTRVDIAQDSLDPHTGEVWLTVRALDSGASPRIHWA